MTWQFDYDTADDKTTLYWNGEQQATIEGEINVWRNGYPATEQAREAVAEAIQNAGTPDRIRMQYDFNYGFSERNSDTE